MEFVEGPTFSRHISEYLNDDDYRRIQAQLGANPQVGNVMPGTGGFRKLRWGDTRRGKGRRGGMRIIYYYFPLEEQIWLVTLYDKEEAADLTPKQKKALKVAIQAESSARRARRTSTSQRSRRAQ